MLQISDEVYLDEIFSNINIQNKLLPSTYERLPYIIIKDFISQKLCSEIAKDVRLHNNSNEKAKLKDQPVLGVVKSKLNEDIRKTNIYELKQEYVDIYNKQFLYHLPKIEEFYKVVLSFSTPIQALEYKEGYFYKKHADDSSMILKDGKVVDFLNVAPRRKLTTVLFTTTQNETKDDNIHFSGGELVFNYLYTKEKNNIILKPSSGDMVIFPSNPYFTHEVLKVTKGYRLSLVQWHDIINL